MSDDFFGGEQVSSSDLPRYAINDDGKENSLTKVQGIYEDSVVAEIQGKDRLLHRIKCTPPVNKDSERILLWGNYDMDQVLPTLTPGTKVRITFKGKETLKGGRTLKRTPVEFPATAKIRPNPFKVKVEDTDHQPF